MVTVAWAQVRSHIRSGFPFRVAMTARTSETPAPPTIETSYVAHGVL